MVGLLDIAPVSKPVDVDGHRIDVPGVSAEGIAILLEKYPQVLDLRKLMADGKNMALAPMLFKLGPKVLHAVLAAGCGYPGNENAEQRVAALDVTAQADLLDAILSRTLSKGLDHFLERLRSIQATLSPPVTLADKIQESVRKRQRSSSPSSSLSEEQVTQLETSGA